MNSLRAYINQTVVDSYVRRERRRNKRERMLVVSNHWDGSVQVFYHFILGYFAPLVMYLNRHSQPRISVRDCGPMNEWFDLLRPLTDVQIVKPGVALHSIVGKRTRFRVVQGLDYPDRFQSKVLLRARREILDLVGESPVQATPVLVIDRATEDLFHSGPESETEMSGSRRRSVPNLSRMCSQLLELESFSIVDMAHVPPRDQVAVARQATSLIAQHGSGLAHMVWMQPGSTVIEIHPPLPAEAQEIFRRLAEALGHRYIRVPQESVHAPISEESFSEALVVADLLPRESTA